MKTKITNQAPSQITLIGALIVFFTLVGCARTPNSANVTTNGGRYRQIERLARPAINEGLVVTNDFLNAFNSIPPSLDLSPAASKVVAEAAGVLGLINKFGTNKLLAPAPAVADVAAGFLPDVLRIDTRNSFAISQAAYNGDFTIVKGTTAGAMLTGGRKIEDDVMDITLSYLLAGNPGLDSSGGKVVIRDGVSYAGLSSDGVTSTTCENAGRGINIANPGHRCLVGQVNRLDSAVFPFLAEPN